MIAFCEPWWNFRIPVDFQALIAGAAAAISSLPHMLPGNPRHDSCCCQNIMEASHLRGMWRHNVAFLACGIASSLLYAAMIWAIRYEGYSLVSQVPSELTAIGAPTERLWVWLGAIYTLLVAAFGWGVWRSAGPNRAVRIMGGLILAYASLGLLWPFAPMHQREVVAAGGGTLSDTMHIVLGAVTVFLMFLTIGFGATAFGKRFRLYSIASVVVLVAFGVLTFLEAPRLGANLPTPLIGLWERINISVFLLWLATLAAVMLRTERPALTSGPTTHPPTPDPGQR